MADRTRQQLGNYTLVQFLGRGGQAEVYLGEHRYLHSSAALKVLHASLDDTHVEQFLAEAQTLVRLAHPSIVRVLDFTVEQGTAVLIMDYAAAGTMRQRYPPGTCVPLATVVSTMSQIASALQYAHTHHVIHRDVKPENLLLGAHDEVLLSDFGLSVFAPSPELLSTQAMAGTLPYMAPEQLQGRPCFASDQYSLAIVAYEWLTGRRPFTGSQWQLIQQQLYAAPPSLRQLNPSVPAALEAVILRALAKDPRERYVSVQGFAYALERASQHVHSADEDAEVTAPLHLRRAGRQDFTLVPSQQSTQPLSVFAPSLSGQDTVTPMQPPPAFSEVQGRTEQARTPSSDVNRQRFLAKVRAFWITGVLEQSLHGAALIALGLCEQPDAVANPWHLVIEAPGQSARARPSGTSIVQAYDDAIGELLILGEPGSGKTTLLLELARTLLDRAEGDERHPMPVVFNLSSWASKRQPLDAWLIEELTTKYQVPRKLGKVWVEAEQILPLLDGLDEVAPSARVACVEAINVYRLHHGLVPTVVCSRRTEYLAENVHILLRKAVVVQPLTEHQIEVYLVSAGEHVASLCAALCADPELRALATSPLMLSVLTLAYQGMAAEDLPGASSPETLQRHVLEHYVQRMLQRRGREPRPTPQQTTHWLTWLAGQMQQHGQTVFYIERMQPDWLSSDRMRQAYDRWAVCFPGILMGLLVGLASGTLLPHALLTLSILLGGFTGWLLSADRRIPSLLESSGKLRPGSWFRLIERLRASVPIGLGAGLCFGLLSGLSSGLLSGLSFVLSSIVLQTVLEKSSTVVSQTPQLGWRLKWQHLIKNASVRNGILVGLLFGLSFGLSFGFSLGLPFGLSLGLRGLLIGLPCGLIWGLSGDLLSVLLTGKSRGVFPTDELAWSWRSLGRSLLAKSHTSTTLRVILLIGLSYGLLAGLLGSSIIGLLVGLALGLSFGLSFWLLLGLFQGVSSETISDEHRVVPNQGIRRSVHNSLVLGLISTVIVWLSTMLSAALYFGLLIGLNRLGVLSLGPIPSLSIILLSVGLSVGPILTGLSAGLLAGLLNGGLACVRHGVVRLLLWRAGSLPWNYPRFLDYAAERILLRKVGGGYIFVHRLLLEYFATLDTTPRPESTTHHEPHEAHR